jgi:sulfite reductase alpha subunit-like flavoprotein
MAEGQRHDRTALILYGSETGNSQDAAEALGRAAERLHFATRVSEMDCIEIVRPRLPHLPNSWDFQMLMNVF